MNRNTRLIVLVLVAAVLVTSVQAATVSEAFSGALNTIENFFAGGWQQHEKSLAFMIVFVLFFSAFMIGAKKAFGEMNRPVVAFCVTAALLTATILVITSNFTLVRFGIIASGLLFLMVMAAVHTMLMKLGMDKTGWSLLLAFLITAVLFAVGAIASGEDGVLSGLGAPFRWLDGLGDGVSSGSSGGSGSRGSSGEGFFSKVGGWFKDIFSGSGSSGGGSGGGTSSSGTSAPSGTSAERTQQARERAQQIIKDEQSGDDVGFLTKYWGDKNPMFIFLPVIILLILGLLFASRAMRKTKSTAGDNPLVGADAVAKKTHARDEIRKRMGDKYRLLVEIEKIGKTRPQKGIKFDNPTDDLKEFVPWLTPPRHHSRHLWHKTARFMKRPHLYDTLWVLRQHYEHYQIQTNKIINLLKNLKAVEVSLESSIPAPPPHGIPDPYTALRAAIAEVKDCITHLSALLDGASGQKKIVADELVALREDVDATLKLRVKKADGSDANSVNSSGNLEGWVADRMVAPSKLVKLFREPRTGTMNDTCELFWVQALREALRKQIGLMPPGPGPHGAHGAHGAPPPLPSKGWLPPWIKSKLSKIGSP